MRKQQEVVWMMFAIMLPLIADVMAAERPSKILCGPSFSVSSNTDSAVLLEDAKALNADALMCFSQDLGEPFRLQCDKAGITLVHDSVGPGLRASVSTNKDAFHDLSIFGSFGTVWSENLRLAALNPAYHFQVCVPDEFTWHNAQLRYTLGVDPPEETAFYCADESTLERFRKESGMDLPAFRRSRVLDGKVPAERQYAALRYKWAAETIREWASSVRKANPKMGVAAVFSSMPAYGLERYPSGIAWDILGAGEFLDMVIVTAFQSHFDYRGLETHYYISETAKTLAAAFGPKTRTGVVTQLYSQNDENDPQTTVRAVDGLFLPAPLRPVDIYGSLIAAAYHGATILSCFDGRWVMKRSKDFSQAKFDAVKRAYDFVRAIEPWLAGGRESGELTVLLSRASEDYYQLDNARMDRDCVDDGSAGIWQYGGWAQPANYYSWRGNFNQESSRGFRAGQGLMRYLFKRGYVFRVQYLDQPLRLDLADARLIIMPFPYCLSTAAKNTIELAVKRGATLVAANQLGELDENGVRHDQPVLADLLPGLSKGAMTRFAGLQFNPESVGKKPRANFSLKAPNLEIRGAGLEAAVTDAEGHILAVRRELGRGMVYFISELTLSYGENPSGYGFFDSVMAMAFNGGQTAAVPDGIMTDVEAGYRRTDSGACLGLINWNAKAQKVSYHLPEFLRGKTCKVIASDQSSLPVEINSTNGVASLTLDAHQVCALVFSSESSP